MATSTTEAISEAMFPNGVTTEFPFEFDAPSTDEIAVVLVDSDGAQSVVSPTSYSVELNSSSGGTVTFSTAPASGTSLFVLLDPDFAQETEFTQGGGWIARAINNALDLSAYRDRAIMREVSRSVSVPYGETGLIIPSEDARKGNYLMFDPVTGEADVDDPDNFAGPAREQAEAADDARLAAELARDQASDLVLPANIFVDESLATAEAATSVGDYFKIVDSGTGLSTIYERTGGGSTELYSEATSAALSANGGSGLLGTILSFAGAIGRTIADRFEDEPSIMDFIPAVERVKIRLGTSVADLSTYFEAAASQAGSFKVPAGTYVIDAGADIPANCKITGSGAGSILKAVPTGSYTGMLNVTGDNVQIEGLHFEGTNASLASTIGANSDTGAAIRGANFEFLTIKNCFFSKFKMANIDEGVIGLARCNRIRIEGCNWLSDNERGKDITVAYSVGDVVIHGNISVSGADAFAYVSSVNPVGTLGTSEVQSTSHIIITDNIHIKWNLDSGNLLGRHGVVVHYNGGYSHAIIENNVLLNGTRHGIYLRGDNTVGGDTGPDIVKGNIVRYFGGGENEVNWWGYNSGIKVEVTLGAIVSGNLVEKCGYEVNGVARAIKAAGIEVIRAGRDLLISDNTVRGCSGGGIMLAPTTDVTVGEFNLDKVDIVDNRLLDNAWVGLNVGNRTSIGVLLGRVNIRGNTIQSSEAEKFLVALHNLSASAGDEVSWRFHGNTLIGAYDAGLGVQQVGLSFSSTGFDLLDIADNEFHNLWFGASARNVAHNGGPSGVWPAIAYTAHLDVGKIFRFRSNTFVDCSLPVRAQQTAGGRVSFIEPDNVLIDCDSYPVITYTTGLNRLYWGSVQGADESNNVLVELHMDTVPTAAETFNRGDRIKNMLPSAGGVAEWAAVTTAAPPSWKAAASFAA